MARKINYAKGSNDNKTEIYKYVIVLGIVVIIFVVLYFFTGKIVTKDLVKKSEEETKVEIQNEEIIMGSIFNRIESSYYVLIYDTTNEDSEMKTLFSTYSSKEDSTKIYYVDLSKKFNSSYYDKDYKYTKIPASIDEVKVSDETLYLIKDKKIVNVYTGKDSIKEILSK